MENQTSENQTPRIVYVQREERKNKIGTAGFVFAMLSLFLGVIPVLGWIFWLLGIIFSSVGLGRSPKGLAPAGLVVSIIALFVIIIVSVSIGYSIIDSF